MATVTSNCRKSGSARLPTSVTDLLVGEWMRLSFEAKFVDCVDAIDGEILQVTFDTLAPGNDDVERRAPYVLISTTRLHYLGDSLDNVARQRRYSSWQSSGLTNCFQTSRPLKR